MSNPLLDKDLLIEILKQGDYEDWFNCMRLSKFHYHQIHQENNLKLILSKYYNVTNISEDIKQIIKIFHQRIVTIRYIYRTYNDNHENSFDYWRKRLIFYKGNFEQLICYDNIFNIPVITPITPNYIETLNKQAVKYNLTILQNYYILVATYKFGNYTYLDTNQARQSSSDKLIYLLFEGFMKYYNNKNNFKK